MEKKLNVGLFGFGCVGQGLHEVSNQSQGLEADLKKVCIKNADKKRSIDSNYFTVDPNEVLKRDDVDVIVELINDSDEAFDIVSEALKNGNDVVTANKKLIAERFTELYDLHIKYGGSLLYEGAVGGSIPIIRNLEEYYDNELLSTARGIVNGSCNYILSKMENDLDYDVAVKEAQEAGFAELDPWLDVAGYDSKYKLVILAIHAFGLVLKPETVLNIGIQNVSSFDIQYAKEKGLRIKLLATAQKSEDGFKIHVIPAFVDGESLLYDIANENNAIEVEGAFSDKQFLVGKGAGSHPTGSAVLSDLSALTYNYNYGFRKLKKHLLAQDLDFESKLAKDYTIKLYVRYNDEALLDLIEINKVYEKYSSENNNFVIADVKFESLFKLMDKDVKGIFVAQV
jgi:homoserine dehydrogenase